jgi:hypothetical protein
MKSRLLTLSMTTAGCAQTTRIWSFRRLLMLRGEALVTVPPRAASASNRADRRGLARNIARYTAQAIALGNQNLPVTHATLSGHELQLLLA